MAPSSEQVRELFQWLEQGDEFDPGTSFAEVIR